MAKWDAKALKDLPTLFQGQCCSCKVDTGTIRVWLCRIGGGVTVEQFKPDEGRLGRWEKVSGGCTKADSDD